MNDRDERGRVGKGLAEQGIRAAGARAQVQVNGVQLVPAAAGVAVGLRRLSLAKGSDVMRRRDIGASPTLTTAGKSWAGQRFR